MRYKMGLGVAGLLVLAGTLTALSLMMGLPGTAAAGDSTEPSEAAAGDFTEPPEAHAECLDDENGTMMADMGEVMDEATAQSMVEHMTEMHPGDQDMDGSHEGMMEGGGHMDGSMGGGDHPMH